MSNDSPTSTSISTVALSHNNPLIRALAWMAVGIPLLWGVALTATKAAALFR